MIVPDGATARGTLPVVRDLQIHPHVLRLYRRNDVNSICFANPLVPLPRLGPERRLILCGFKYVKWLAGKFVYFFGHAWVPLPIFNDIVRSPWGM